MPGMENAETIAPVESRLRKHRSALTNGNRLFVLEGNADGRSATYRRFAWNIEVETSLFFSPRRSPRRHCSVETAAA
jgi:hypothetical protein